MMNELYSYLKSPENRIILIITSILLAVYFVMIYSYTYSYPFWGDDWYFISLIERFRDPNDRSLFTYIVPYAGGLHPDIIEKAYVFLFYQIANCFDYKWSVVLANLLVIPILAFFLHYMIRMGLSRWKILGMLFVFFSLKGNIDNFNFGGVMMHDLVAVIFIVGAAYLFAIKNQYAASIIITNLFLLLVSSEAIGLLFLLNFLSFCYQAKYRYFTLLLSVVCTFLFFEGYQLSKELLQLPSSSFRVNYGLILGPIVFVGGLVNRINIASLLGFFVILFVGYNYLRRHVNTREENDLSHYFLPIILFSLLVIGLLVQIGRGIDSSGQVIFSSLMANRFAYFHLMALLILYISLAEIVSFRQWKVSLFFLTMSVLFYGVNFYNYLPLLKFEMKRIEADAYNFKINYTCLNYKVEDSFARKLAHVDWFVWPSFSNLEQMKNYQPVQYQANYEGELVHFVLMTPNVVDSNTFAFLHGGRKLVFICRKTAENTYQATLNAKQISDLGKLTIVQLY